MRLRLFFLAPLLLMFASCGTFGNLSEGIAEGRKLLTDINSTISAVQPEVEKSIDSAKKLYDESKELFDGAKLLSGDAADLYAKGKILMDEAKDVKAEISSLKESSFKEADKDGDGNLDFLEKIAYWVLLAGGGLEAARRKLKSINTQFDSVNGRIEHERSKRKASETSS